MSAASAPNLVSFPADPERDAASTLKPWQHAVIKLLAQGCSIAEAMRRVHLTEDAFYKARDRQPEFAERTKAARELHRAQVEDAFHSCEAYARRFVDLLQRDLNAPLGLRLRASLAILNRRTGAWLPPALPSLEAKPEVLDALASLDIPDTLDTLDNLDTPDTHQNEDGTEPGPSEYSPETATWDSGLPPEEMSSLDDPTALDILDRLDSEDTPDTLDELDIPDTVETADILDELTACFGSRELAERFYELASQQDARKRSPGLQAGDTTCATPNHGMSATPIASHD